jgi:hypothetical protein
MMRLQSPAGNEYVYVKLKLDPTVLPTLQLSAGMDINHRQGFGYFLLVCLGCARALRRADAREWSDST